MATTWTIRVTPREGERDYETLQSVLSKLGGGYVVVREYGDEEGHEHYHAVVFTDKKDSAARSALTNAFKSAGQAVYSMKKCDEGMMKYILKGDAKHPEPRGSPPEVVARHGMFFTEEKIKSLHDAYWAYSEKTKASKDLTFPMQVEHYMKNNAMDMTFRNAVKATVEVTLAKKNVLNRYHVQSTAMWVMAKNDNGFKRAFIDDIANSQNFFSS